MGIQTTRRISRKMAIDRIKKIKKLVHAHDYHQIDTVSHEDNQDIVKFVDEQMTLDITHIEKWTDIMLEDRMDMPYYRLSLFDNYIICGIAD